MSKEEIGCCGAYCRTCRPFAAQQCRGCKLGYATLERDLSKAKCKIKICCLNKQLSSCADCAEYPGCEIITNFHDKQGQKYGKYRQAISYIRDNGYDAFLAVADHWKNAHGRYN